MKERESYRNKAQKNTPQWGINRVLESRTYSFRLKLSVMIFLYTILKKCLLEKVCLFDKCLLYLYVIYVY